MQRCAIYIFIVAILPLGEENVTAFLKISFNDKRINHSHVIYHISPYILAT